MVRTVESAFAEYLTWLTPTELESEAAKTHRASIHSCLQKSLGIESFYRCGSFGNGTSISGFSDVDYIAALPYDAYETDSNQLLRKVRDILAVAFPRTSIVIDAPAIAVRFGANSLENTEVVPGQFHGARLGEHRTYHIADGGGNWFQTCPPAHKEYIRRLDERYGGRIRPIIRFLKAWKYHNSVPISSFYLESFVALHANRQNTSSLSYGTYWMLDWLHRGFPAITSPVGTSSLIWPCRSDGHRQQVFYALIRAHGHAENAMRCTYKGNTQSAIAEWRTVFKNHFPSPTP